MCPTMRILRPEVDVEGFFAGLRGAAARLLVLDYDGTLAPFRVRRDEAVPYPGVREALAALLKAGHTRVVLLSGRAVENLLPLLALEPVPEVWGSHGWERRWPGGRLQLQAPPEHARKGLEEAKRLAVKAWPEACEVKPVSIAVHWRGRTAAETARLRAGVEAAWPKLAREHGLEVHAFDGGYELRVPGRDKGTAVATLLEECGGGVQAAYLGDDQTDEDAFRALAGRGLAVLVREEWRPTAAAVWLRPPAELLDFFQRWMTACPPRTAMAERKSGS